ncbi:MAG: type II toxin-antitoxin system Phd/YefM family antitoxin [Bryobacteraceae bacterium]
MKTFAATEAKQRFGAVIDAAQREPVVIRRQNRDVAIVLSPEDYERIRKFNTVELDKAWDELSRQAQANGLTEEILEEILADDSPEK